MLRTTPSGLRTTFRSAPGVARLHEARLLWNGNPGLFALLGMGRFTGAVREVPRLGWVVTDPVLARRILNDTATFSMLGEGGVGDMWTQLFGPEMASLFAGARHVELRTMARDLFTEEAAKLLVDRVQGSHHAALRERLADGETVDVADLARVLSGLTVADLLGLEVGTDDEARSMFAAGERLASLALGTHTSTELPGERIARAQRIVAEITVGVEDAYASAGPDTILGRARAADLGVDLARGVATLLAIAGTETGASSLSRTVAILHDTGQQHLLVDRPDLLPGAVREGLRVTTPAPVIGRHVAKDAEIGGHAVAAGSRVMMLTYVADNSVGRFDVTRAYVPETRQLWFGAGPHLCLGAAVARVQLTRLLESVTAGGRPYRVVSRRPARRVLVPTYASLRITAG
jgi:cytochrome P450